MITFIPEIKAFYLDTDHTSYVIRILDNGFVSHGYYGARIPHEDLSCCNILHPVSYGAKIMVGSVPAAPEAIMMEYPTFGRGDYRGPAAVVVGADGTRVNELHYVSHRIISGKPLMAGMPQLDAAIDGVQTLELLLRDEHTGFEATLSYSVFEDCDIISRRTVIRNIADVPLRIDTACSACLDLNTSDYEMITLQGAWARERSVERCALRHGTNLISSCRGASGHQLNPFAAFADRHTDEQSGRVYGMSLIYSGDFQLSAEVDQFHTTRVRIGLNPDTFAWTLQPGESFDTPEAVLTYSEEGLGGMSHHFHDMCRRHLGKCADRSIRHPLVINSWEAMYFDFDEDKMIRFIKSCAGLGIDTVVMDDGWFGSRDDDTSSLGDWFVHASKLPNGLTKIIDACHAEHMKFGIWFEPEMVSRNSRLFEAHPDWHIHIPGRQSVEGRNQMVLDFSRPEVVNFIFDQLAAILEAYDISYVKWDMNRNITDNGSAILPPHRQGELAHRYILGVYRLMQRLEERFPQVFFEGCAGGGGRFDFGILYYMPQIWTSDDTDAIERMNIQYGTSLVYPLCAMSAHVSACPNHQTGRITPMETRGDVAQLCSFGFELDPGKLSQEEKDRVRLQAARHRRLEDLLSDGSFYRLRSPFETPCCAWQMVSQDCRSSVVMFAWRHKSPNGGIQILKLRGLDPHRSYHVAKLGITCSGAVLMNAGLALEAPAAAVSLVLDLEATPEER